MSLQFLLFFITVPFIVEGTLSMKTVIFPSQTSSSYVEMIPMKGMQLGAFTLCMQVAMENSSNRDVILFAYAKTEDELNVWRRPGGGISLYLGNRYSVFFNVPDLTTLYTHLCLTWDTITGASTIFMNGRRSLTKILQKGHLIPSGGKVLLGQDADNIEYMESAFDANQSLVGEVSEVNMWDYVLTESDILDLYSGKKVQPGNIFNWDTTDLRVHGNTVVIDRQV